MQVELMALTPNAEEVIEDACRTCYLSFHRKNPPESTRELIQKILEKGHHSVLEHASATFRVLGASRVFTHEMVRHRFVSPSQQSQRYVSEAAAEVVVPPSVEAVAEAREEFAKVVAAARDAYKKLVAAGVPREDARYLLPGGAVSEIVLSANFREWRHVFEVRCHPRAHWEIRRVCLDMLRILQHEAPIVFADFVIDEERRMATLSTERPEAAAAAMSGPARAKRDKERIRRVEAPKRSMKELSVARLGLVSNGGWERPSSLGGPPRGYSRISFPRAAEKAREAPGERKIMPLPRPNPRSGWPSLRLAGSVRRP